MLPSHYNRLSSYDTIICSSENKILLSRMDFIISSSKDSSICCIFLNLIISSSKDNIIHSINFIFFSHNENRSRSIRNNLIFSTWLFNQNFSMNFNNSILKFYENVFIRIRVSYTIRGKINFLDILNGIREIRFDINLSERRSSH